MNPAVWNVVPVFALLTLAAAPACTQATQASQTAAEKAKEAAAFVKQRIMDAIIGRRGNKQRRNRQAEADRTKG